MNTITLSAREIAIVAEAMEVAEFEGQLDLTDPVALSLWERVHVTDVLNDLLPGVQ